MIPPRRCDNSPTVSACRTPAELILDGSPYKPAASRLDDRLHCSTADPLRILICRAVQKALPSRPAEFTRGTLPSRPPADELAAPRPRCSLKGRVAQTARLHLWSSCPFTFKGFSCFLKDLVDLCWFSNDFWTPALRKLTTTLKIKKTLWN